MVVKNIVNYREWQYRVGNKRCGSMSAAFLSFLISRNDIEPTDKTTRWLFVVLLLAETRSPPDIQSVTVYSVFKHSESRSLFTETYIKNILGQGSSA